MNMQNERVLVDVRPSPFWTWPGYVFTLGLWEIWRRKHHYILTDQRVVSRKGIVTKHEHAVPLSRIQDAAIRTSIFTGGAVLISTAGQSGGTISFGRVTRADARKFHEALTALLLEKQQGGHI